MKKTQSIRANETLTPDFTIRGLCPTKLEYETSLEMLRAFAKNPKQAHCRYMGRDMTQVEHDVWCALHQCGILRQGWDNWVNLSHWGMRYAIQRGCA